MSTQFRRPTVKRKSQDIVTIMQPVNNEPTSTSIGEAPSISKRRKTTKSNKQKPDTTTEKRLFRYRSSPTADIRIRIQRALSQRLYLLAVSKTSTELTHREYKVLGQTGNVYTVIITQVPSCTCPDHAKGHLCKHIIFVLHRVLKVDRNSPLLYQKALLITELNEIFTKADAQRGGITNDTSVLAERQVREAYQASTGDPDAIIDATVTVDPSTTATTVQQKTITADADCPICFESMYGQTNDQTQILFCSQSCGNNMHTVCFDKWRQAKLSTGEPVTCPFCRIEWKTKPTNKVSTTNSTGYLNLAAYSTVHVEDDDDDDDEDEDEEDDYFDHGYYYYGYRRYNPWRRW